MNLRPEDEEKYLSVLAVLHYVLAGLVFLVGCFPIIHLTLGLGMLFGDFPAQAGSAPPPEGLFGMVGGVFVGVASAIILGSWSLAASMIVCARSLERRRRHTFCLVVAFLEAMMAPFGTILGLLTILLLVQPSVRARFDGEAPLTR